MWRETLTCGYCTETRCNGLLHYRDTALPIPHPYRALPHCCFCGTHVFAATHRCHSGRRTLRIFYCCADDCYEERCACVPCLPLPPCLPCAPVWWEEEGGVMVAWWTWWWFTFCSSGLESRQWRAFHCSRWVKAWAMRLPVLPLHILPCSPATVMMLHHSHCAFFSACMY